MTSHDEESDPKPALPEQRLGATLRQARESRGLSLREMARQLGYNSHSTLSVYEKGGAMATDEVVAGYEQILELEPNSLREELERARIERHGDVFPKRRTYFPIKSMAEPDSRSEDSIQSRQFRWRQRPRIVIAAAVVIAMAAIFWVGFSLYSEESLSPVVQPEVIVSDSTDPKVTGCADDGETLDWVEVYLPDQYLAGVLELRASKRCGTSWGKFIQTPRLPEIPTLMIEINAHRPADSVVDKFSIKYAGQGVYGNQLVSRHQCVYVEVLLSRSEPDLPATRTKCVRSGELD